MRAQLRSEFVKLVSTRTYRWLALGTIAMAVVAATTILEGSTDFTEPLDRQGFFFVATFTRLLLVVFGIRMITDEFRFGTAVPTMTFTPARVRVVLAKCVVGGAVGLAIAAVAQGALLGTASVLFAREGHDLIIGADGLQSILGAIAAGSLWVVIGVAVGAIVRNQLVATVGTLVWLMVLEEVLRAQIDRVGDYLPGQASFLLSLGSTDRWTIIGAVAMTGWALVGATAGSLVVRRADVS